MTKLTTYQAPAANEPSARAADFFSRRPIRRSKKPRDPWNEWFQRNWPQLLREFFTRKPRIAFDSFCDMKFVERRETLAGHFYKDKPAKPRRRLGGMRRGARR